MATLQQKKAEARDNPAAAPWAADPGIFNYVARFASHLPEDHPVVITVDARSQYLVSDINSALIRNEKASMPRQIDVVARDLATVHTLIPAPEERKPFADFIGRAVAPVAAYADRVRVVIKFGRGLQYPYNNRNTAVTDPSPGIAPALCASFECDRHGVHPGVLVQRLSMQQENGPPSDDTIIVGMTFVARFGKFGVDQSNVQASGAARKNSTLSAKGHAVFSSAIEAIKAIDSHATEERFAQEQETFKQLKDSSQAVLYMMIIENEMSEREMFNLANAGILMTAVETAALPLEGELDRLLQKLEVVDHLKTLPSAVAEAVHVYKERLTEYREEILLAEDKELEAKQELYNSYDAKTPRLERAQQERQIAESSALEERKHEPAKAPDFIDENNNGIDDREEESRRAAKISLPEILVAAEVVTANQRHQTHVPEKPVNQRVFSTTAPAEQPVPTDS